MDKDIICCFQQVFTFQYGSIKAPCGFCHDFYKFGLHSNMDRLKPTLYVSNSFHQYRFTFQYGSIKAISAELTSAESTSFTFQYGSIKASESARHGNYLPGLHSNMDRLKRCGQNINELSKTSLHSNMDRLKRARDVSVASRFHVYIPIWID